jgi:hypothetical protein
MRDLDVRSALRLQLRNEHADDPNTLIIEELGLCERTSRIDLAVVNGSLHGYEIKSARDTLERLPAQAAVYSRIFDTVTVVADSGHLPQVRRIVPRWWGLTRARWLGGVVVLHAVRKARQNPSIDPFAVAQLLWRDEALAELEVRQRSFGVRTAKRELIWRRLADTTPLTELGALVRQQLKIRQGWRVHAPQK